MKMGEVSSLVLISPKRGSWTFSDAFEGGGEALDAKDFFFGSPPLFA